MTAARALVAREADGIAILTINRPEARNALDADTLDAIGEAFVQAESDPQVRRAILLGAGDRAFAAGADIKAMADADPSGADLLVGHAQRLADRLESSRLPVIAAVHGFALGGGLELALACDFIFAARGAKLGFPEVGLGVIPGMGGTQRLARRIGVPRARELIYRGALVDADEAARLGFVNEVTAPDALLPRARAVAAEIAANAPLAVQSAKRLMRMGMAEGFNDHVHHVFLQFLQLARTQDFREGMASFLEKRPADFQGR